MTLTERAAVVRELMWQNDVVEVAGDEHPLWVVSLGVVLTDAVGIEGTRALLGPLRAWCRDRRNPAESARMLAQIAVYAGDGEGDATAALLDFADAAG